MDLSVDKSLLTIPTTHIHAMLTRRGWDSGTLICLRILAAITISLSLKKLQLCVSLTMVWQEVGKACDMKGLFKSIDYQAMDSVYSITFCYESWDWFNTYFYFFKSWWWWIAVSFGYKSVDDYYFDASSSRSIKDVKVPLLCIQVHVRCQVHCMDHPNKAE